MCIRELGVSTSFFQSMLGLGIQTAIPLLLTCLVLCRLRRTAIAVTAALTIYVGVIGIMADFASTFVASYLLFGAVETVALIASGGPRRGLEILTWQRRIAVLAGGGMAGFIGWSRVLSPADPLAALVLAAVTVTALALLFPMARRILILLAIPAYPAALAYVPASLLLAQAALPGGPRGGAPGPWRGLAIVSVR